MLDYIKSYPKMIRDAVNLTKEAKLPVFEDFDNIVVCGVGGSAVGGDMLKGLVRDNEKGWPVDVSRRYKPPAYVGERTIAFCVSYSGNTEETLSQFVELRKRGCNTICLTSGGKLKRWCERFGTPFVELPSGFRPRAAMPYLFIPILYHLSNYGIEEFSEQSIQIAVESLESVSCTPQKHKEIKNIAEIVKGNPIKVYGPAEFKATVIRAKNQFNENSKLPSCWAVFPELNHNEIVGYEDNDLNKEYYAVMLRDEKESEVMKTRIETTKDIIDSKVKGVVEIWSDGETKLERTLSFLYYIDILSYYLGYLEGKSVEKNDLIDKLKLVLREEVNLIDKLESELA